MGMSGPALARKRAKEQEARAKFKADTLLKLGIDTSKITDPVEKAFTEKAIANFTPYKYDFKKFKPSQAAQDARNLKEFQKQFAKIKAETSLFDISPAKIEEAKAAGVDQRTIDAMRIETLKQADEYFKIKEKAKGPGMVGSSNTQYLKMIREQGLPAAKKVSVPIDIASADVEGRLKSDVAKQPELQEIRRKRKKAVTEVAQKIAPGSKSGIGALLSERGGAGFFTRYFKA